MGKIHCEENAMLFRKKMEPSCAYCAHGARLGEDTVLCAKKGLRTPEGSCRKFRYDPCKRIPGKQKTPDFSKYDQEDYSL